MDKNRRRSFLPETIKTYFEEIKEAYAFGHGRSCIALCRALLEIALFDKLKEKGYFRDTGNKVSKIDLAEEDNLFKYINLAKQVGILPHKFAEISHQIKISANKILHLKGGKINFDQKDTIKIIFKTIEVIEYLNR